MTWQLRDGAITWTVRTVTSDDGLTEVVFSREAAEPAAAQPQAAEASQ
jgi:hypothetical protein